MAIPRIPANTVLAASVATASSSHTPDALSYESRTFNDWLFGLDHVPYSSASAPPPPKKARRTIEDASAGMAVPRMDSTLLARGGGLQGDQEIELLKIQINSLRAQLVDAKAEADRQRRYTFENVQRANRKANIASASCKNLQQEIKGLREAQSPSERDFESLHLERNELQNSVARLKENIATLGREISVLRAENSSVANTSIKSYRAQVCEESEEIHLAMSQRMSATVAVADGNAAQANAEVHAVRMRESGLILQINMLQGEVAQANGTIASLRDTVVTLQQEAAALRSQLQSMTTSFAMPAPDAPAVSWAMGASGMGAAAASQMPVPQMSDAQLDAQLDAQFDVQLDAWLNVLDSMAKNS